MRIERLAMGVLLGAGLVARAAGEDRPAVGPRLDVSVLDRSANPCTDFYRFACGGWIDREPRTEELVQWTRLDDVLRTNVMRVNELLREQLAGQAKEPAVRKMQDFYASCMDETAIEAGGLAQLQEELGHYGRLDGPVALAEALARLHRSGIHALFVFTPIQEPRNPSKVIPALERGEDRSEALRKGQLLLDAARLGEGEPSSEDASLVEVQERIELLYESREMVGEEVRHRRHRLTVQELEKRAPHVAWRTYFARMGAPSVEVVDVQLPAFVNRLDALLAEVSAATWSRYFKALVADRLAERRALPRMLEDEEAAPEREKRCAALTLETFLERLGELYEARTLGPEGLRRGQALVNDLQAALASQLESSAWLDGPTRAEGLAKVRRIAKGVGHPPAWSGYAAVPVSRASFLRNVLEVEGLATRRGYELMGRPADRGAWVRLVALHADVDYRRSLDQFVVPVGVLQEPFFGPGVPEPFTYGALGWLGGRALMSGFDLHGRQYDASGRLRDWWSDEMLDRNRTTVRCLQKQYAQLTGTIEDSVRGDKMVPSTFADNAGVQIALGAFRLASARRKFAEQGGLTPEQQFFVGVAQSQCSKLQPSYSAPLDAPPPSVRVNGTLANVPELGAAFHCPAGSAMVRAAEERCSFW
jgi:endothelin-converting enzyme/putative endopeptidase